MREHGRHTLALELESWSLFSKFAFAAFGVLHSNSMEPCWLMKMHTLIHLELNKLLLDCETTKLGIKRKDRLRDFECFISYVKYLCMVICASERSSMAFEFYFENDGE